MSKAKELTEQEIVEISEKSGVDCDIVRSWYKGNFLKTEQLTKKIYYLEHTPVKLLYLCFKN